MLLMHVRKNSGIPVYQQIVKNVIGMIDSGTLQHGYKMPPTRVMAQKLGLNRSTIVTAYEELTALGYLKSNPGSYTSVCRRHKTTSILAKKANSILNWKNVSCIKNNTLLQNETRDDKSSSDLIDFSQINFDKRLIPLENFTRCTRNVIAENGRDLLRYGSVYGYNPLRKNIAEWMKKHSVSVHADEILITNGSQEALSLLCLLFSNSGKNAAIESPTYSHFIDLLKLYHIDPVPISMTSAGLDLTQFEYTLKNNDIGFLYTIPSFHNPTGISTSQSHREKLLSLCEKYKIAVIEDGFDEEMKYWGKVTLPIKSMDQNGIVIYVGTFSKTLFPGLRVGWIAGPKECIDRLAHIRIKTGICGNQLTEATLNEFLRKGYYNIHLVKTNREFKRRMETALKALEKEIRIPHVTWQKPSGGFFIWLELKIIPIKSDDIIKILLQHKVKAVSGTSSFLEKPTSCFIRLTLAQTNENEITEGISRLGKAIHQIYQNGENK